MEILVIIVSVAGVMATAIGAVVTYVSWAKPKPLATPLLKSVGRVEENILEEVRSTRSLRVGFVRYPPLIDYAENNCLVEATGLYAEIINRVAQDNSWSIEYIPLNMSDILDAVKGRSVHLVLSVFQTPERSKEADFSALLHSVKVGGITLCSQKKVKAIGDLQRNDVRIAVCKGEIGHEWAIGTLRIPKRRLKIVDTHDIPEIANLVESRVADVCLADFISLTRHLNTRTLKTPSMKAVFRRDPVTMCPNGVMVERNQTEWADWLDTELRRARELPDILAMEAPIIKDLCGIIQRY